MCFLFLVTIQPVNLPSGSELNNDFVSVTALASGFGITRDGMITITQYYLQFFTNTLKEAKASNRPH